MLPSSTLFFSYQPFQVLHWFLILEPSLKFTLVHSLWNKEKMGKQILIFFLKKEMLTHKAQWIHRRQSSFCSVTITWRSGCHRVGQGCHTRPIVWGMNECVSVSDNRASVLRMASIVPMLLEGLGLTNGKHSFSPSPNLCVANQIYHYGYNADL